MGTNRKATHHRIEPVVPGNPFLSAERAAEIVRAASPHDFPASMPFYILCASDVSGYRPNVRNCPEWNAVSCHAENDPLKSTLQSRGLYRGPGPAAMFRDGYIAERAGHDPRRNFTLGLGILIHETAHWLVRTADVKPTDAAIRNPTLRPYYIHSDHGPVFTRAGIHLWHRVNSLWPTPLECCEIAGSRYGLRPANDYLIALASEVQTRRQEPITAILRSEPPRFFTSIWSGIP